MAEQATKRLYFPPGTAPFGEMNFVRADYNRPPARHINSALRLGAAAVIQNAWASSEWLQGLTGMDSVTLHEALQLPDHPLGASIKRAAEKSFKSPTTHPAWYAIQPPIDRHRNLEYEKGMAVRPNGRLHIAPGQVVGLAHASLDVSGNRVARAIKRRRHPEKVYAKIAEVDVRAARKGQGIGITAIHAALSNLPPEKRPTVYLPTLNKALISKADEFSFKPTGTIADNQLLPDYSLELTRLQGESVQTVLDLMVEHFPWLAESVEL